MKNKALLFSFFLLCVMVPTNAQGEGYYNVPKTCNVETIVRGAVEEALKKDRGLGAGLIRLLFHDCFVGGCDGSVLLDASYRNPNPEKEAPKNIGLRGFEVIDEAKRRLEKICPGVVSCADILAFAARDASDILNSTTRFNVTTGRLDSKVSSAKAAEENLPPPEFNLDQLKDLFVTKKGLTVEDLVVLTGAHTIGRSHCSSIKDRLYPTVDPTLDTKLAEKLKKQCPEFSIIDDVVFLDHVTPKLLDNQFYKNDLNREVVFFSDWSLLTSNETKDKVVEYATIPGDWEADFADSMEKLSKLNWITNPQEGEIRKNCRAVN